MCLLSLWGIGLNFVHFCDWHCIWLRLQLQLQNPPKLPSKFIHQNSVFSVVNHTLCLLSLEKRDKFLQLSLRKFLRRLTENILTYFISAIEQVLSVVQKNGLIHIRRKNKSNEQAAKKYGTEQSA